MPLRSQVVSGQSVRDYFLAERRNLLDAYQHRSYPLARLIRELDIERDPSRPPLVGVIFNLDRAGAPPGFAGLDVEPIEMPTPGAKFELNLNLLEDGDELLASLEYRSDLFSATTIKRWLRAYELLLQHVATESALEAREIPWLSTAERHQLQAEWNDTRGDYSRGELCLHELIEAQVAQEPNRTAVVFDGEHEVLELTYLQLDRRAERLAHQLRGLGVGPDVPVGIFAERSLEMVVGLLAVLKAEGAYIPFEPSHPATRLEFMLEDARPPVLLVQGQLQSSLPPHNARVIALEEDPAEAVGDKGAISPAPERRCAPGNLAYVIYTSGSTGKPKGAMNSHRAIVNRLLWMKEAYQVDAEERVLQKTPYSFDVSVWEFFLPLIAGGRLVVARPEGHKDSAYLANLIASQEITSIHFVPSMLQAFLGEPTLGTRRFPKLRQVIASGEALSAELQRRYFEILEAPLHNLYGPTEAAVDVTSWCCEPELDRPSVPIGRPMTNLRIHLLDHSLSPVPIGVAGELYIGGRGLARGYWRRPGLTAERFIPDPVVEEPGARLYRSGDLARHMADGAIDFLGRTDFQVKIRGFRIELGEIEAVLNSMAEIREAVLVARTERVTGGEDLRLVAYCVADGEALPAPEAVRRRLEEELPPYMVPAAFVELDVMPLLPNGKLDRKQLPAPEWGSPRAEIVEPRTAMEDLLAGVWADVLGRERVGVTDSLFDLGGHSLLAIRILSRIRESLGVTLALGTLFANPTVAQLASVIEASSDLADSETLTPRHLEAHEAFWLERFAEPLPVFEPPVVGPRSSASPRDVGHERRTLDLSLVAGLQGLENRSKESLELILLAIFQVFLHRLTGQDDLVLGVPSSLSAVASGRHSQERSRLLPLRSRLGPRRNFLEHLRLTSRSLRAADVHREYPLARLIRQLALERDPSRAPLVGAIFQFDSGESFSFEDLDASAELGVPGARLELDLRIGREGDRLAVGLHYRTDLFDPIGIRRWLRTYELLLQEVVMAPEESLLAMPWLTPSEHHLLTREWSQTSRDRRPATTLGELFESQVQRTPERTALVCGRQEVSFGALDARVNRLANALVRAGIGMGDLVGVRLDRGVDLVVSLLAVLKAGAAYVPIDPKYPAQRQRMILEDAEPPVLITRGDASDLPRTRVLCLSAEEHAIAAESSVRPESEPVAECLAYLIYTSGSTGRPKGVAIEHRAACALVRWAETVFSSNDVADVLFATSVCFDLSIFELFVPLSFGGTVHLAENALQLPNLASRSRVSLVNTVPSAIAELVQSGGLPQSVRLINLAGEPLRRSLIDAIYRQPSVERVFNLYGPSEDTTYSTFVGFDRLGTGKPSIGRPIAGTQCYILDAQQRPVPQGVQGEICLSGGGLARGYWRRPSVTAAAFIPCPFSQEPGHRMYRTGDLGRHHVDGQIDFLGRIDHQVKIRGFRIELGEIEVVLGRHPAVGETVVIARPSEARDGVTHDPQLVAYVVAAADSSLETKALRGFLSAELPAHMVPSAFVELEAMPLLPNGKLDRKRLPAPTKSAGPSAGLSARASSPRTATEEILAGIWSTAFAAESVGIHEKFLELGGHSLIGTRLLIRVREVLDVDLPLNTLFSHPTVAQMAELVDSVRAENRQRASLPLVPTPASAQAELSFGQQRTWLVEQLEPGNAVYNMPTCLRLRGALEVAVLAASLSEVVRRHEVLRTSFPASDGKPVQRIHPATAVSVPLIDLHGLGKSCADDLAQGLLRHEIQQSFDLAVGPLLRVLLIRMAPQEHLLTITMHHIVSDGWSMGIFFHELSVLYQALMAGEPSPLPELELRYADFAHWQRQILEQDLLQEQIGYWRRQLADAPSTIQLPVDRSRGQESIDAGGFYEFFDVPIDRTLKLRQWSQQQGATLYMTVLSCFQLLLTRYSGDLDISIGTPIAGRNRPGVEALIGLFVDVQVMRAKMGGNPSFPQRLAAARETLLEAHAYQEVPFERLVEELQPERALDHTPLFQVMFVFNSNLGAKLELGDLEVESIEVQEGGKAAFDLTLSMLEDGDRLVGSMDYKRDLFDRTTILRMVDSLQILLREVAENPERTIAELPMQSLAATHQVLVEGNETQSVAPASEPWLPIHELIASRALANPEAPAVVGERVSLTYGELDRRARHLAQRLRDLGVGPESPVGLCVSPHPDMVTGILATLWAGGAYVPLDPAFPRERLAWMLEEAQAVAVITQERWRDHLSAAEAPLLCLDAVASQAGLEAELRDCDDHQRRQTHPRALAYIMFTSGSTGWPKGVAVDHGCLASYAEAATAHYGLKASDRMLQFSSTSFDISVEEIFPTLGCGATLVLANEDVRHDARAFFHFCDSQDITVVSLPTAYWHELAATVAEIGPMEAPSLRLLTVGGERLRPERLALWQRDAPARMRLINSYGPTETTVVATLCEPLAAREQWTEQGEVPIGRPLSGVQTLVLDRQGVPVPLGVAAEVFIGGAGVTRGYVRQPAMTAAWFVPDPWSSRPGARLYRTGDLARRLASGSLQFVGRVDHQVKYRGFRIEPGEIEARLAAHPGVDQALVLVRQDDQVKRLVAYFVPPHDGEVENRGVVSSEQLRRHLSSSLPEYMVPTVFVPLETFPLTVNGKLDRRALPEPEMAGVDISSQGPRTPVEELIAMIWSEVLGHESIGVEDSFFELGGHSLLATQVMSRLRLRLGVDIPLRSLFEAPTVASLAAQVEAALRAQKSVPPPIESASRTRDLPLSFAQQRLWLVDRLLLDKASYNVPFMVCFVGDLKIAVLEGAFSEIVRRHEVLRTRFPESNGQPRQVILEPEPWRIPRVDLRGLPTPVRNSTARKLAALEAGRVFDLARDALLRTVAFQVEDREAWVVLTLHHIVSDGWSVQILMRELEALYRALATSRPSPLEPLPVQYADFALWQQRWLAGEVIEAQLSYWQQRLAGAQTELELPTDRPRSSAQGRAAGRSLELSKQLSDRLRVYGRQQGVTLYMTLLSGYFTNLYRFTGQRDLLVGTPIAGRHVIEVEDLIGFFVNLQVMRAQLTRELSFSALVAQIREAALGAYANQDLPFEKLVDEISPERDLALNPLVQTTFQLVIGKAQEVQLPGVELSSMEQPATEASKFDLTFSIADNGSHLAAYMEYDCELFDDSTIARLLGGFERLLTSAADDPETPVARLPVLSYSEHQQVVWEWNATCSAYPKEASIARLFDSCVEARSEAIAVVFEGDALTYRELDRQSNRLAQTLRRTGVGPEVRVGVAVERSLDLIVALLGVLKAGGAYVPLDPSYPRDRLELLMEVAEPSVVLIGRGASTSCFEAARCLDLDAMKRQLEAEPDQAPAVDVSADHLAYIVFTSGSTGRPKGVAVNHRAVVRLVRETNYLDLGADETFLQFAPVAFDASTLELWGPLLNGGRLVVAPAGMLSLEELGEQLQRHAVTTLWLTAGFFHQMVEHNPEALQGVRQLLAGGDVLQPEAVRRVLSSPGCRDRVLINGYGPTENTTFTTCHRMQQPPEGSVPIGEPISNTRVYVLDADLQPVPPGTPGELLTGGDGVARGYFSAPAATAQVFVPDPFASISGGRLYRTGDRVRFRTGGVLEFQGRLDHQVKIRGFRVEPGETEVNLRQHPALHQALVLARDDAAGDKQLVAYVVGHREAPSAAELKQFLRQRVPEYMV
ncbi:MAG: amino acid adenylation domain-containing protein, partial [Acidobacteriota bacterium]